MGHGALQNGNAFAQNGSLSNGVTMRRDQTKDIKWKLKFKKKTKSQR